MAINNETAFAETIQIGRLIVEEGTVRGRGTTSVPGLTEDLGAAKVNGPSGAKGQYLWDGTYIVELDRGVSIPGVHHLSSFGHSAQDQRVFGYGERVTVTWLNRRNVQVPVILDGCTIDFYNKQLLSQGHLLDMGERIIRSAMADSPGAPGNYPFANNQFDDPNTSPNIIAQGESDENVDRVVGLPGSELFLDKFGRIITLSRNPGNEFLVTHGKIDSGQDDVSDLDTVSDQDTYYAKITNDESDPVTLYEPFAPKTLNLSQYQQTIASLKVVGDKDANRTVKRGILPRFDKWIFKPILVRKYKADSDGDIVTGTVYSTYQERAQTDDNTDAPIYGYTRTVTDHGDIKEFVPRHINQRIVGDYLQSIGGNYELKVKTTDRLKDGTSNPINLVHREYLADGTIRMRVNEDLNAKTATYDCKVSPDGGMELYIKEGGGSSTDNNVSIKYTADGTIDIKTKKKIVIDSDAEVYVGGETDAEPIPLGDKLKAYLDSFMQNVFNSWIVTPADGGAALKLKFTAWYATHSADDYLSDSRKVNNS